MKELSLANLTINALDKKEHKNTTARLTYCGILNISI